MRGARSLPTRFPRRTGTGDGAKQKPKQNENVRARPKIEGLNMPKKLQCSKETCGSIHAGANIRFNGPPLRDAGARMRDSGRKHNPAKRKRDGLAVSDKYKRQFDAPLASCA